MYGFEANERFSHQNNVTGSGFPVVRVVAPVGVGEGVQSEFTTLVCDGKILGAFDDGDVAPYDEEVVNVQRDDDCGAFVLVDVHAACLLYTSDAADE